MKRPPTLGEAILRALLERGDIGLIPASDLRRPHDRLTVFIAALPPDLSTALIRWRPDDEINFDAAGALETAVFCHQEP